MQCEGRGVVFTPSAGLAGKGNEMTTFNAYLPNGETIQVRAKFAIGAQYKAAQHMLKNGTANGLFNSQVEGVDFIKVEAV